MKYTLDQRIGFRFSTPDVWEPEMTLSPDEFQYIFLCRKCKSGAVVKEKGDRYYQCSHCRFILS